MKTPDEIYDILDKALAEKKAAGCKIVTGSFGDGQYTCCAVTALGPYHDQGTQFTRLIKATGNPGGQLQNIVNGFDLNKGCDDAHPLYQVGKRLREKYAPM